MHPDHLSGSSLIQDPVIESARRHGVAVGEWSGLMGRELGFDAHRVGRLVLAGQLHDVGKVDVPRHILLKPGPLTSEEWRVIRRHPEAGARVLSHPFFDDVREFVLHHHERFDGLGYPYGLFGRSIPIEARIIGVADAWCAMTCDRPYRAAISDERALGEIRRCAGSQFDPECAELLRDLVLRAPSCVRPAGPPQLRVVAPAPPAA